MVPKSLLYSFVALSAASPFLHAATPANAEQEFEQVRKIALRDPKVRGAYEEADHKLEAKILQIDPALADYIHHRSTGTKTTGTSAAIGTTATTAATGGFHPPKKTEAQAKPSAVPAPKPAATTGSSYVVKKGDTLGAIASQYHVTVAALKSTNHIVDEKKLAVGQTLTIPHH